MSEPPEGRRPAGPPAAALSQTPPILPPGGLFERFAPQIAALPQGSPLAREALLTDDFLLCRDGPLEVFYAPFDAVNERARVVLLGITPGWYQTELAFRTARDALVRGDSPAAASAAARQTASFSGAIRTNLVAMCNQIGLPEALGLASAWELFGTRLDLLHTTAVVRYPVFVGGANFTGYAPDPLRHPVLRRFVTEALAQELAQTPEALLVPLGRVVGEALGMLAREGLVDAARCLLGLPHPSGANAHRHTQLAVARAGAAAKVRAWFGGGRGRQRRRVDPVQ
jgi:hypothetical protein